jgi:hypothetical protein
MTITTWYISRRSEPQNSILLSFDTVHCTVQYYTPAAPDFCTFEKPRLNVPFATSRKSETEFVYRLILGIFKKFLEASPMDGHRSSSLNYSAVLHMTVSAIDDNSTTRKRKNTNRSRPRCRRRRRRQTAKSFTRQLVVIKNNPEQGRKESEISTTQR